VGPRPVLDAVKLLSILTSALYAPGKLHVPAALHPGEEPSVDMDRGWAVPRAGLEATAVHFI